MKAAIEPQAARPRRDTFGGYSGVTDCTASTNNRLSFHSLSTLNFPYGKSRATACASMTKRREVTQMLKLFTFVQIAADSLRKREEGQTMAEYGVVLAVIAVIVTVALLALSGAITGALNEVTAIL